MHEAFISVVVPVDERDDPSVVAAFLEAAAAELDRSFTDFEIVVVDNRSGCLGGTLSVQPETARNCYVVRLAARVPWDVAVFAGLERANGDYVIVFDAFLQDSVHILTQMYEEAQDGHDYVVLSGASRRSYRPTQRRLFFWLLRKASPLAIDPADRKEILVSRRALNWALRHRSRAHYVHELYGNGGFTSKRIPVSLPLGPPRRSDRDRTQIAWAALTRLTEYPLRLAQGGLLLLSTILFFGVANALTVRLLNRNIFGGEEVGSPGWAYLVVLISVGFLLTNVSLYALLRTLRVLADDIRDEPLYIVEQVGRLG